jgi:hypothetical protein
MSLTFPTPQPNNAFEIARRALIAALVKIEVPKAFGAFPTPGDFHAVNDCLREIVAKVDDLGAAFGAIIRDNANCHIDAGLFSGTFSAAIEGNETYAIECCAEALVEERRGVRRASSW